MYIGPNLRADQRALIDGNDRGNSHGMIKKPNDPKNKFNPIPQPDAPNETDALKEADALKATDAPKESDALKENDSPKEPDTPKENYSPKKVDVPKEVDGPKENDTPKEPDAPKEAEPKRNRVVKGQVQTHNLSQNPAANATNPKVSLLILTFNKASTLQNLLEML